jgi:hypothetical protein
MRSTHRGVGVFTHAVLVTIPIVFVCEDDHGCAPLPVGDDVITAIQNADPRPRR